MQNIIKDILWYLLNKLDPLQYKKIEINKDVIVKVSKQYFKVNDFNHISLNINYWLKIDSKKKPTDFKEIELHVDKKSKLKIKG